MVPSRLEFGGDVIFLVGGLKVSLTSDRDERDDKDDDELVAGELFDALVQVLFG